MWLTALTTVGAAGSVASTLLPIRGLHDWMGGEAARVLADRPRGVRLAPLRPAGAAG